MGRRITERTGAYPCVKWHGEGEVGTLSSKARTKRHHRKLLSIRLEPREMFYIMHVVKLEDALPQAVVASKSKWTWREKVGQYLAKWRPEHVRRERRSELALRRGLLRALAVLRFWRKRGEFVWLFLWPSRLPGSTPSASQKRGILTATGQCLVQNLPSFTIVILS